MEYFLNLSTDFCFHIFNILCRNKIDCGPNEAEAAFCTKRRPIILSQESDRKFIASKSIFTPVYESISRLKFSIGAEELARDLGLIRLGCVLELGILGFR